MLDKAEDICFPHIHRGIVAMGNNCQQCREQYQKRLERPQLTPEQMQVRNFWLEDELAIKRRKSENDTPISSTSFCTYVLYTLRFVARRQRSLIKNNNRLNIKIKAIKKVESLFNLCKNRPVVQVV